VGAGATGVELAAELHRAATAMHHVWGADVRVWTFNGNLPKFAYLSLQIMRRATLIGWRRAVTLMLADGLRRSVAPPVKLH
jgi:hypothetical protein